MYFGVSSLVFLTAIFCIVLGDLTAQQSAVDLGRILIFLSVTMIALSMLGQTINDIFWTDRPKPLEQN